MNQKIKKECRFCQLSRTEASVGSLRPFRSGNTPYPACYRLVFASSDISYLLTYRHPLRDAFHIPTEVVGLTMFRSFNQKIWNYHFTLSIIHDNVTAFTFTLTAMDQTC